MKITKEQLKQLIEEELGSVLSEVGEPTWHAGPAAVKTMSKYGYGKLPPWDEDEFEETELGHGDTGPSIGSLPVGNPTQWAHMSDQLRQMSRVWDNAEDGKYLELAADALRRAVEIENQRGEDILKR